MMIDPDDLVAAVEIAAMFGVKTGTVAMWKQRDVTFPVSLKHLSGRDVFLRQDIEAWGRRTGRLDYQPGHYYDADGYDVTHNRPKRRKQAS